MAKAFNTIKTQLDPTDRITFGKYANLTWQFVIDTAPDYLIWCVGNTSYSFSYDCIVSAIKNKYILSAKSKTEAKTIDEIYLPKGSSEGHVYATKEFDLDDLFTDIPF